MDDDKLKALMADLEDNSLKYWKRALQIGREKWREHSSQQVLTVVGDDYDGGLLSHDRIAELLGLLDTDATAQYVLLAHNKAQAEHELEAEDYQDTAVHLLTFASPRILAERSVTGRNYMLYMDQCAACLKADCAFVDCPGNFFGNAGEHATA